MDIEKLQKNLNARGIDLTYLKNREEAARYLLSKIRDTTVGIGGSKTIDEIGIYEPLCETNQVFWHWKNGPKPEVYQGAAEAEVYLSSANAIAETGEIVNIDGRGNRVAALSFADGKRLFIIAGINKVREDLAAAIERARQVAAPPNVKRIPGTRPCTETGTCFDCRSKDRVCCTMQIMMYKPMGAAGVEVVLIGEELGF